MKYLTFIAAIFLLVSCENQGVKQKAKSKKTVVHQAQTTKVTLDNGEKWNVNFATKKGIANMKSLVESIEKEGSAEYYIKLGKNLQNEFNTILRRCDMTGEAHNQLHNYLAPMPEWFKTLKQGSPEECRSALTALEKHLDRFNLYFN